MPIIIHEMIANVRPDSDTVAVDSQAPQALGGDALGEQLRQQQLIEQERQERLQID